jgi:RNA polymerase sigma factor (sigma-70 family)
VGETFAVAIESASQFRGASAAELEHWVWTIARSILSRTLRRMAVERRFRVWAAGGGLGVGDVDAEADLALLRRQVLYHIGRLPPAQRQAVTLRMLDDLSYEAVAARLNTTPQAARARVSRGLRELQRRLEGELDPPAVSPW